MAQDKFPLSRQEPDSRQPVNLAPLLGETKQPAQGRQFPVHRRGGYLLTSALNVDLNQSFVNLVEPRFR